MRGSAVRSVTDYRFIKRSFSEKGFVRHHAEAAEQIGLWPSERVLMEKYFRRADSLLDLGCGAGRTTLGLRRAGFTRVTGLDLSLPMIRAAAGLAAKWSINLPLLAGDARRLPFRDGSFGGAIFSFNGLMQIARRENRLQVLREVRRVVAAESCFLFTTGWRLEGHPFWRRQRLVWKRGWQDPRLSEFGDVIIRDGLQKEGFLHFPNVEEINELIVQSEWRLLEWINRQDVCAEPVQVNEFAGPCLFWVLTK